MSEVRDLKILLVPEKWAKILSDSLILAHVVCLRNRPVRSVNYGTSRDLP